MRENYTYRASALAFTTLLGLVPLLSLMMFISSHLLVFNNLIQLAENYLFANLLPSSIGNVQAYLQQFVNKTRTLPTVAMVFFAITTLMLITTISHTFNDIWGIKKTRFYLSKWLSYWLTLFISPFLLGLTILFSLYLFSVSKFMHASLGATFESILLAFLPLLINTLIFMVVYIVTPNCTVKWRNGLLSGFIAALLLEVSKKGFSFYIVHFPSYELIYGILAVLPIFLIWLYFVWSILLFGALINHELHA